MILLDQYTLCGSRGREEGFIDCRRRASTLLISIMQVNSETGVQQPIEAIVEVLRDHTTCFHTDTVQGFAKDIEKLRNPLDRPDQPT